MERVDEKYAFWETYASLWKFIDVIYWCNNYSCHMNAQPELKNKSHFIVDENSASNQRLKKNDDN